MGAVDIRGIVRLVKVKRERLVRLKVKREHRPVSKASDAATEDIRGIVQTRSCRPLPQIMLHPSRAGSLGESCQIYLDLWDLNHDLYKSQYKMTCLVAGIDLWFGRRFWHAVRMQPFSGRRG
jgi:hypothetical protein